MPRHNQRPYSPPRTLIAALLPAAAVLSILVVAFLVGRSLLEDEQQRYADQRERAAQYQAAQGEGQPTSVCTTIAGRPAVQTCVNNPPNADPDARYIDADLHAQQQMAVWAFGMLVATMVTAILTGVGVYLLWMTLVATRDTLREAENATEAALDNIEVTSAIGEAQVRAYLQPDLPHLKFGDSGGPIGISFNIHNSGQSPARKVSWRAGYIVRQGHEVASDDALTLFMRIAMLGPVTEPNVAAGERRTSQRLDLLALSPADATACRNGQKRACLAFELNYADVFGCTVSILMLTTSAVENGEWKFRTLMNEEHLRRPNTKDDHSPP